MQVTRLLRRWLPLSANDSSEAKSFDIYGFDANKLDIATVRDMVATVAQEPAENQTFPGWTSKQITHHTQRTVFRFDPDDKEAFPALRVKLFHDDPHLALRTHNILTALYEFGVSTGPRPFYAASDIGNVPGGVLISEWVHGEPLQAPPPVDDEHMWHRIMAVMGVLKFLPFAKYATQIPMAGRGVQQPEDCMQWIDNALAALPHEHYDRSTLAELSATARDRVAPQWLTMPKIALSRLDTSLDHFIWDGYHLRGIGWSRTDWADVAFDLAQLAADPAFEDVPNSHWVWFRWEYARLSHDEGIVARATTYTQLLQLYWSINLTVQATYVAEQKVQRRLLKQRDRYLKQARRHFG